MEDIKAALRLALEAFAAKDTALAKMRAAGEAFVDLGEIRGAKKRLAASLAEKKGVSVKTAQNFIAACIKAHLDPKADTVRACHSMPKKTERPNKRFAPKREAVKVINKYGDNAEALAKAVLVEYGYTF